jgi:hypothetical protein
MKWNGKVDLVLTTGCAVAACSLLGVACGASPDSTGGEPRPTPASAINSAPIYTKTLGAEHFVHFYDFGQGAIAIRGEPVRASSRSVPSVLSGANA